MIFNETYLKGSYSIELNPFEDQRGWFARFYCKKEFREIGHQKEWVQLNHSFTANGGTIRGMHFQFPPFNEIKMVRCTGGKVFDVIVDLRKNSPTFLKWFGIELSAENKRMLYIPGGFAHGFQSLAPNCELIYHHTEFYTPEAEGGIRHDDPALQIQWPLQVGLVSEKDANHPYIDKNFKGL